ncbi:hypothetical protein [Kocuria sp.]|uniref:hypothetical protein n=1 Tax=Kocuria sp. TaxID=1871328 RepID=UPI0026DF777F|nr:hypothetical protein [Kocuria sp.]MDO5366613.1 hypothetical protein [Kocuria sp.]
MASTRMNSTERSVTSGAPGTDTSAQGTVDVAPETLRPTGPAGPSTHARAVGPLTEGLRMAALKWRLLINTLTRSTWILVGTILGGLYVLFLVGSFGVALFLVGNESLETVRTVAVFFGTLLLAGWWLVPVVSSKADSSLDPSRLALFPLRIPGIQIGQILGAVIGIPGIATLLITAAWISSWRAWGSALVLAIPCALLGLLLAFVGSRAVTALSANFNKRRRAGEIISIVLLGLVVLLGPLFALIGRGVGQVWEQLPTWAGYLAWSPLGATWAIPADVARGQWGAALGRLAITVATLAVLVVVWRAALRGALADATGDAARSGSRSMSGVGLFGRLPATGWGAVMARCLTYWLKDPRYSATLLIIPAMAAAFWFISEDGTGPIWVLPCFVALLMAYAISADVGYDNTAFTLHILAPVKGSHDRLGRALAMLCIGVPFVIAMLALSMVRTGGWSYLPGMIGICAALLLAGTGVVSVMSARYTYPVPPPGASPLKTPQGYTLLNVIIQFVILGAVALMALPPVILLVTQVVTGQALWGWLALAVGIVEGLGVFWVGIVLGGKWLDRRAPELLQEVAQYR